MAVGQKWAFILNPKWNQGLKPAWSNFDPYPDVDFGPKPSSPPWFTSVGWHGAIGPVHTSQSLPRLLAALQPLDQGVQRVQKLWRDKRDWKTPGLVWVSLWRENTSRWLPFGSLKTIGE